MIVGKILIYQLTTNSIINIHSGIFSRGVPKEYFVEKHEYCIHNIIRYFPLADANSFCFLVMNESSEEDISR